MINLFTFSKIKRNLNNIVERVILDKQKEIISHQVNEERLIDLKKKAKQKRDLDKQIKEKRKMNVEEL